MKPPPDPELEAALRASLEAHARQAPPGDDLAARILAAAEAPAREIVPLRPPRRTWGRFTLPAAAAVLAAIIGIVVAFVVDDPDRTTPPVADTSAPAPVHPSTPSPTARPSSPTTADRTPSTSATASGPTPLHGVHVYDLTFTGTDDGWALASAQCIDNPAQRCTAIMRSTDGVHWTSHPGTSPFNVADVEACSDPCVDHLRFATDQIGYAYGPSALFMTTDGGATWNRQAGGAFALESADQNVVRVDDLFRIETAPIGSTTWTPRGVRYTGNAGPTATTMTRNGRRVYLLFEQTRGGPSTLFTSGDDGATWSTLPDPCSSQKDAFAQELASNAGGHVAVLCRFEQTAQATLLTSDNAGGSFVSRGAAPQRGGLLAIGKRGVYLLALDGLSRTTDSGATWRFVPGIKPSFWWLGFENDNVARVATDTAIWTTRNGGSTWTKVDLP